MVAPSIQSYSQSPVSPTTLGSREPLLCEFGGLCVKPDLSHAKLAKDAKESKEIFPMLCQHRDAQAKSV
jgi:hypothetical protein